MANCVYDCLLRCWMLGVLGNKRVDWFILRKKDNMTAKYIRQPLSFMMESANGTMVDMTGYVKNISYICNDIEVTSFSDVEPRFIPGIPKVSIEIESWDGFGVIDVGLSFFDVLCISL